MIERNAPGGYPKLVIFNFLQLVIKRRTYELLRWKQH